MRLTGGGQNVTVDHVGQVVSFDVFVTVTGKDANGANDALQIVTGSLLSSNISGGSALGNILVHPVTPFNASGSANGTQGDLDGDTDLDIGNNDLSSVSGDLAVRSAGPTTDGTVSGASNTFKIATGTFTVTGLLGGVQTN